MSKITSRKDDHIDLSLKSQHSYKDVRFEYEPMFGVHPDFKEEPFIFLGKKMNYPFWISSMTGGGKDSKHLNKMFAQVCRDFGIGMGLGSCRALLENQNCISDFDLRETLGGDVPFLMNLGIAQVSELIKNENLTLINDLVEQLRVDGLIIHINPLQEFFQPEGDVISARPIDVLEEFKKKFTAKIMVKEIGQGMGERSLRAINDLEIDGLELAGFGGTNFTKLEKLRSKHFETDFESVGEDSFSMIKVLNDLNTNMDIIISGGMNNPLNAYYYHSITNANNVIGQASKVLEMAQQGPEILKSYIKNFILKMRLAKNYLEIKQ